MQLEPPDRRHPVQKARDLAQKLTDAIKRENEAKAETENIMNEINSLSNRAIRNLVVQFFTEATQDLVVQFVSENIRALQDEAGVPRKVIAWPPLSDKAAPPFYREKSYSNWQSHNLNKDINKDKQLKS
jgi:hypothetical protein